MQCKVCDYRLWNLKARQCPECGTPFTVSDYEFIPNSVQFCCPDCGQAYYGTGHKGHLVPVAFVCVKCGRPLHMNDTVLLPTEGVDEELTEPQRMPWLDRGRNGWWRSWWSTARMSLFSPAELAQRLPANSPVASAWWFALVNCAMSVGLAIAILGGAAMVMGGFGGVPRSGGTFLLLGVALLPLLFIAALTVWATVTHLVLRLTGGTAHGLRGTCEAVCYSTAATLVMLVPVCGAYIYGIWWLISASVMLKERQQVHGLRATLSLMALPFLMIVGLLLVVIPMASSKMVTATGPWTPPTATAPASRAAAPAGMQAMTLAFALNQYARDHRGYGPQHVVELVVSGDLVPQNFVLPETATTTDQVPIADARLDTILSWPGPARTVAVKKAIASLPKDVVAYRLGDFIFTYPGMDFRRCNRQLWTVIAWPDPDANPGAVPPTEITVGLLDGTTTRLYGRQMALFVADQNALRVQNGLPPLPELATIRHASPAAKIQAEQDP